jgi:hypothetical protein
MRKSITITGEMLARAGACPLYRRRFAGMFGRSVTFGSLEEFEERAVALAERFDFNFAFHALIDWGRENSYNAWDRAYGEDAAFQAAKKAADDAWDNFKREAVGDTELFKANSKAYSAANEAVHVARLKTAAQTFARKAWERRLLHEP